VLKKHSKKILISIFVGLVIILVAWFYSVDFGRDQKTEFGVTFSDKYASELGLDWQQVFSATINDLGVRQFRLVLYWDQAEKENGVYDWSTLDWQLNELNKVNGQAIVAIGQRVPRWPECHTPAWATSLPISEQQERLFAFLRAAVEHYKNNPAILAWQVENEPFLNSFGICQKLDRDFYRSEIAFIRTIDTKPIVITESGELSTWLNGGVLGDAVGTSIYRVVWNKWFGYFHYPLPPAYYYLKAKLVGFFTGEAKFFVSEMQMEPWSEGESITKLPLEKQAQGMDAAQFKTNIQYVCRTGLTPVYLWGVEWWYWLKEKQNDSSLWLEAKKIWQ